MSLPTITAAMITGKCPQRVPLAVVAVRCFLAQTYPNKRLLVVNHADKLPIEPSSLVEEHLVSRVDFPTLGDLRNHVFAHTPADHLIAVWDDDDWFAPAYLATLQSAWRPEHLVLIKNQVRHDLDTNTSFLAIRERGHWGQVLYAASTGWRYPALERSEDVGLARCFGRQRVVVDNDPGLYVRTCHGSNTWSRSHIMGNLADRYGVHRIAPALRELVEYVRGCYGR